MKAVILAGGFGTRISEESHLRPKPMIKIGNEPIIRHIINLYANHGINEFLICCGYKGEMIKEYVKTINTSTLNIKAIDTGLETMTGGRIKRIEEHVDDTFCVTYGDGLSDVNISKLIEFHRGENSIATLTAIHPPERFGVLDLVGDKVTEFREKHSGESSWINGGFFVFEPSIFDYLNEGDSTILEKKPLETLAKNNELSAFKHNGFWHPMDTLRDKKHLEKLWNEGTAPWKV